MNLNWTERQVVRGPLRGLFLTRYAFPRLRRMMDACGVDPPSEWSRVLEIGAGTGQATRLLIGWLRSARPIEALEPDHRLRRQAARRLGDAVRWVEGHAGSVTAPSASFDAVCLFETLHHVDDWRAALREVARVLRPGGWLLLEETHRKLLDRWWMRALFRHPAGRFDDESLRAVLDREGFDLRARLTCFGGGHGLYVLRRRVDAASETASAGARKPDAAAANGSLATAEGGVQTGASFDEGSLAERFGDVQSTPKSE